MEYLNVLKELPGNFMKCGIAGWCLEVMFTSVESVLARDWPAYGKNLSSDVSYLWLRRLSVSCAEAD